MRPDTTTTRVLLKLSGEQFAGEGGYGINPDLVKRFAGEISDAKAATGAQIVIVAGGGNIMRGATVKGSSIQVVTGHYMGMLAGVLNGLALVDILNDCGVDAVLQSRLVIGTMVEPFVRSIAVKHIEDGKIVLMAGGSGLPYVTHDTASVTGALELGCEMVLKGTNVDGVYDKDPRVHTDAKKLVKISHHRALTDPDINVFDAAAISLALENELPIVVFDLMTPGNITRAIQKEPIGTTVA
ncbi:MAG TPA: uridine monophosphate kinase [Candidatus Saccharimonadia bacterium]|nr:uridine monophosphate kinase [Candidatus Saccharimonadia bacterium]